MATLPANPDSRRLWTQEVRYWGPPRAGTVALPQGLLVVQNPLPVLFPARGIYG